MPAAASSTGAANHGKHGDGGEDAALLRWRGTAGAAAAGLPLRFSAFAAAASHHCSQVNIRWLNLV